jgi:GTPase SAR1 family protein
MSDSEEEAAATERLFKIVLVGDSQAGKTAICQRSAFFLASVIFVNNP